MTSAGATAGEMNVLSTSGPAGRASDDQRHEEARQHEQPGRSPARRARSARPPTTPAPHSTYVVTLDDVPIAPPTAAARGVDEQHVADARQPPLRRRPARPRVPTATAVPIVSKKSVMNSAKIVGISASGSASPRFDGSSASPIVEKSCRPGPLARSCRAGRARRRCRPSTVDGAIPDRAAAPRIAAGASADRRDDRRRARSTRGPARQVAEADAGRRVVHDDAALRAARRA